MRSSLKIILKKNRRQPDAEQTLYLRIIKDREAALMSLGISAKPEYWNSSKEEFKRSKEYPLGKKWNDLLHKKREEVRLRIFELEEANPGIRAKEIKELLSKSKGESFIKYLGRYIQHFSSPTNPLRNQRFERFQQQLNSFQQGTDLQFEDLTEEFIQQFEAYLVKSEGSTIGAHMVLASCKEVVHHAMLHENPPKIQVENDPFANVELKNDFVQYIRERMKRLLEEEKLRTHTRHRTLVGHLERYLESAGKEHLFFEDLNVEFLQALEHFLITQKIKINTRHTYLKTLRTCLYEAIRADLFPQERNPFFKFKLKKEKTQKPKLDLDQIHQLESLELKPGSNLWHTRNSFLFMFYCAGMRVGDMIQLRWLNIRYGRLQYRMEKTNKPHGLKLIEPVENILKQYHHALTQPDHYIFPWLDPQGDYSSKIVLKKKIASRTGTMNRNLKMLGNMIELDFPLTNHIARHSFSRIIKSREAKALGIDLHDIQGALNHSSVSITENYLEDLDENGLDQVMDSFETILRNNH